MVLWIPYINHVLKDDRMTALADFVAQQDAQNTIQLNIRKYCLMLCDALELDFKMHHPDSNPYKFYIESGESITRSLWRF